MVVTAYGLESLDLRFVDLERCPETVSALLFGCLAAANISTMDDGNRDNRDFAVRATCRHFGLVVGRNCTVD